MEDENEMFPIPNSIYNNESGFTHDYYSGTTATPDQPTRCLGITAAAWASGGPVSGPQRPALSPVQHIQALQTMLAQALQAGQISPSQAKKWGSKLDTALRAVERERSKQAIQSLQSFIRLVQADLQRGKVSAPIAQALISAAQQARAALE
jgi:hypothetical protein